MTKVNYSRTARLFRGSFELWRRTLDGTDVVADSVLEALSLTPFVFFFGPVV